MGSTMAFISTQKVAEIRSNLKNEFPAIKFSVVRRNYSAVNVTILKSPYDFRPDSLKDREYLSVNSYWFQDHGYKHPDILNRIIEIANEGNHNNSDVMTDYFDVGWYFDLSLGQWNKPFQVAA